MKKLIPIFSSVCLVALLNGCATVGNKFDTTAINKLKEGSTTETQAIALLGSSPTHRQTKLMNSPNPESWQQGDYFLGWKYAQGDMFGNGNSQLLVLMFSKKKILKEIVAQSSVDL